MNKPRKLDANQAAKSIIDQVIAASMIAPKPEKKKEKITKKIK